MFWPRVCCSWALLLHGLSTKTLSQPRGLISLAATVILRPCLWRTTSQSSSAKTTTCRRSPWRINVRRTACFDKMFSWCAVTVIVSWMVDNWPIWGSHYRHALFVQTSFKQHATCSNWKIKEIIVGMHYCALTFEMISVRSTLPHRLHFMPGQFSHVC